MKKILCSALAATAIFGLASCSSDEPMIESQGDGVNFVINLPGDMKTRATFGDESKVTLNNLQWTIYEVTNDGSLNFVVNNQKAGAFAASQTQETVTMPLVKGKTYQVAFYADNSANSFISYSDGSVNVDYTAGVTNDREEDAFIGKSTVFTVTGAMEQTVTLTRPFAQLNWGTDDYLLPTVQHLISDLTAQVEVSSGLYSTMNVITGEVSNPVESTVAFPAIALTVDKLPEETFPVEGYKLLAMNYLLTGKGTIDCSLKFNNDVTAVTVNAAPVNVNYRTNIYGSLFTAPGTFNIIIDPNWDGEYDANGWDGTSTLPEGIDDASVTTITINTAQELAGFAQYVNAGNNLRNRTVLLGKDINLNSLPWTPIASTNSTQFNGTFDGQGHTIKNLYINAKTGMYGLFGYGADAKIKNLVIENAQVTTTSTNGTGILAGSLFTGVATNITIKGNIQVTGSRYVGTISGHNAYGKNSDITIDANAGSFVKATSNTTMTPSHVGGVIGYMGEGSSSLTNVKSNLDVIGGPGLGGIVGTAQAGNTFTNCSSSATVTMGNTTSAKAVLGIGGIAGCHVLGATITFNQCSFTGNLVATLSGEPYSLPESNNIVGTTYGSYQFGVSGTDNVVINP